MNVSELPPDLRLPWLTTDEPGTLSTALPGATVLRGATELPDGSAAMDVGDMDVLESAVDDMIGRITDGSPIAAALLLTLVLAAWDEEFRAAGLYSGNVYLASERSVPQLTRAAGVSDTMLDTPVDRHALLTLLFHTELIYRFPVAIKFRGTFGVDRQFRLNCWGRRLATRIARHDSAGQLSASVRGRFAAHLHEHHDVYSTHMALLRDLTAVPAGAAWESAKALPIGVLI